MLHASCASRAAAPAWVCKSSAGILSTGTRCTALAALPQHSGSSGAETWQCRGWLSRAWMVLAPACYCGAVQQSSNSRLFCKAGKTAAVQPAARSSVPCIAQLPDVSPRCCCCCYCCSCCCPLPTCRCLRKRCACLAPLARKPPPAQQQTAWSTHSACSRRRYAGGTHAAAVDDGVRVVRYVCFQWRYGVDMRGMSVQACKLLGESTASITPSA
jgi:hypothetical protein